MTSNSVHTCGGSDKHKHIITFTSVKHFNLADLNLQRRREDGTVSQRGRDLSAVPVTMKCLPSVASVYGQHYLINITSSQVLSKLHLNAYLGH